MVALGWAGMLHHRQRLHVGGLEFAVVEAVDLQAAGHAKVVAGDGGECRAGFDAGGRLLARYFSILLQSPAGECTRVKSRRDMCTLTMVPLTGKRCSPV